MFQLLGLTRSPAGCRIEFEMPVVFGCSLTKRVSSLTRQSPPYVALGILPALAVFKLVVVVVTRW